MRKHNLHNHTTFSDGSSFPEELIQRAIISNLKIIGISDHAFTRKLCDEDQVTDQIGRYIAIIKELREKEGEIDVKIGLEIDVSKRFGISPEELPFSLINELDYVLFEYVDTKKQDWGVVDGRGIEEIVRTRRKLKIPIGLAHNDLQGNYRNREEEIAFILADNDIFIELNQTEEPPNLDPNDYTWHHKYYRFFQPRLIDALKKREVKFVIGTDSHRGIHLNDTEEAEDFMSKKGLLYHPLVD